MSLRVLQRFRLTRSLLWRAAAGRAHDTHRHLKPFLRPGESILDIGAGICDVTLLLQQSGQRVTALDVQNLSCTPLVKPVLYNGRNMPFAGKQFDTALLLTVLHHIPPAGQTQVLREAGRVAKQVIIIEDVYRGRWQRYATFCMDSLLNLEFRGHPHSNKNEKQWQATFAELGFTVQIVRHMKSFMVLRQVLYILKAP